MTDIEIRKIASEKELEEAVNLIKNTFLKCDGPLYTEEGIKAFFDYIDDAENLRDAEFAGAYEGDALVGVLGTVDSKKHIMAFFVRADRLGKGIGKKLFCNLLSETGSNACITVNAAPYATEIYHKLGFVDTGKMRTDGGIIFTPMIYRGKE